MKRRLLPWWTEPLYQKGFYRRTAGRLSREEAATVQAITRTFIALLLGWFVLEMAVVLAMRGTGTRTYPWVRIVAVFATPVVVVIAAAAARRIVAARNPRRTAIADANAATRAWREPGA